MRTLRAAILATAFAASSVALARDIPELTGPVIDETGTLSVEQRQQIGQELMSFKDGVQIQVWLVRNLENETLETLAIKAFDKWKLGDAKKDNGILVLVAMDERRARVEVGQGLEGDIPDVVAGRIVDSILVPHFRSGDYYGGLSKATRFIYELATGRASGDALKREPRRKNRGLPLPAFIAFIIFFFTIVSRINRTHRRFGRGWMGGGGFGGGGGWGGGGGGWGGGGGGWSGGGGGWSGGGGSSSGGGASGSW